MCNNEHCNGCQKAIPYVGCSELKHESDLINEAKKMISAMEKRIDAYLTHPTIANEISQKLKEHGERGF